MMSEENNKKRTYTSKGKIEKDFFNFIKLLQRKKKKATVFEFHSFQFDSILLIA